MNNLFRQLIIYVTQRIKLTVYKRLITNSGLFDSEWYLEQNPDVRNSKLTAINHFFLYGGLERRNPSPLFDSAHYLKLNPDVQQQGLNPLIHFIKHGKREKRNSCGINNEQVVNSNKFRILPTSYPFKSKQEKKIACVIHIYYPDIANEIFTLVKNIHHQYKLYISVPSIEILSEIYKIANLHGLENNIKYRVSDNRGRNFGPLLVEFSKEIINYDYLLHIHTKKSMYTGSENYRWRRYLYKSLIGSEYLVDLILQIFNEDPDVGVFYPSIYESIPYWGHNWLCNRKIVYNLLDKLNIKYTNESDYEDYPVGGMFWARVDSIRPLLSTNFNYEDFPKEKGQTDGTLAHGIERSICIISESEGYKFVEFDYNNGLLKYNWSNRNIEQYQLNSISNYKELLSNVDLISFDLFDTILVRPSIDAESILKYLESILKFHNKIFENFYCLRKFAENEARKLKSYSGDVNIYEIYDILQSISNIQTELLDSALDTELSLEFNICKVRPGIRDILDITRLSGKKIIIISDTYYTSDFIANLLNKVGIDGYFDIIYLSNSLQARKDRGDIWGRIFLLENIAPNRFLHIGDNEQSDIQVCSDLGIKYFHLMKPKETFFLMGYNSRPKVDAWNSNLVMGPAMLELAGNPFPLNHSFKPKILSDPVFAGFTLFGPLKYTFIAWLFSHVGFKDISHIYFFSREGFLLQKVYEEIRSNYPAINLPKSTYFFISRCTAISASLFIDFNVNKIIEGYGFKGTVSQLLENRIGYKHPKNKKQLDVNICLPEDKKIAESVIASIQEDIIKHSSENYNKLMAYCESSGMNESGSPAVVDIGYSATIQKCLQITINKGLSGFYFGTYENSIDVEEFNGKAYGCFAQNVKIYSRHNLFINNSIIVESFLTASHGQVVGYFYGENNEILPIFGQSYKSAIEEQNLQNIQEGIKLYIELMLKYYGIELLYTRINEESSVYLVNMIVTGRIKISDAILKNLNVDDFFCGNSVLNVSNIIHQ